MRFALIGDSHSQATFPRLRNLLESEGHAVVYEESRPGWGVRRYAQRGMGGLASTGVDAVILSLGGNNANLTPSYGEEVRGLIQQIRQAGVSHILWLGPLDVDPSRDPSTFRRHAWTRDWLLRDGRGYRYLDLYPHTNLSGSRDGVHLTSSAYRSLVDAIWPSVKVWAALRENRLWFALSGVAALGLLGFVGYRLYVRRIDRKAIR